MHARVDDEHVTPHDRENDQRRPTATGRAATEVCGGARTSSIGRKRNDRPARRSARHARPAESFDEL